MMPTSRKGKSRKIEYRPLPISVEMSEGAAASRPHGRASRMTPLFDKLWNLATLFPPRRRTARA